MYQTFIAPSEAAPTSLDIKRALLTYDKVVISDPSDRDYFPPQLLWPAISAGFGIPLPFGMPMGPVRPLGKSVGFDDDFNMVMDEVQFARREGLIDVVSTYDQTAGQGLTIGMVPGGGYPLNTDFLLWAYRNIARDQNALRLALAGDNGLVGVGAESIEVLAGRSSAADGAINDDVALPLFDGELLESELREHYTLIARSRLASVMKTVGYCAAKQLVPSFRKQQSRAVLGYMASRASNVIDLVADGDPNLLLRSRVLDIAHNEYMNDAILQTLSIDDVLRLRSTAWGHQAEARDALLRSAAELAQDCASTSDFDFEVSRRIQEYRSSWDSVSMERRGLDFAIRCDLFSGTVKTLGLGLTGEIAGSWAQMQSGIGAATILFAGCLVAIEKIKEYAPMVNQIKVTEAEFGDHACFGIHEFYRGM